MDKLAELLIRNGANVNVEDDTKMTPIYIAVRNGDFFSI